MITARGTRNLSRLTSLLLAGLHSGPRLPVSCLRIHCEEHTDTWGLCAYEGSFCLAHPVVLQTGRRIRCHSGTLQCQPAPPGPSPGLRWSHIKFHRWGQNRRPWWAGTSRGSGSGSDQEFYLHLDQANRLRKRIWVKSLANWQGTRGLIHKLKWRLAFHPHRPVLSSPKSYWGGSVTRGIACIIRANYI